jgi:hypothetical protein
MKTRHLLLYMVMYLPCMMDPVHGQTSQPVAAQASKDTIFPNVVKINLAAGYFRNISVFYERYFKQKWSFQIGAGYKVNGKLPKAFGMSNFLITSETQGIRGLSFSPEMRYHFRHCDCNTNTGLYAGVYGRFTWLYGELTFLHWDGSEYIDVGGAGDMKEYGIGVQLGYQFTIKERFLVDLFFMGPRTSFNHVKMKLDSDFASEVIPEIEEELNRRLESLGLDPVEIPVSPEFTFDFHFNNFRYGIGIGYIF